MTRFCKAAHSCCRWPQVGYRGTNSSEFRPLSWHASETDDAKRSDGTWGCPDR